MLSNSRGTIGIKNKGKGWNPKPLQCANYASINNSNFVQNRYYVPFGGKFIRVRLNYWNDSTTIPMVVDIGAASVASGRNFNEIDPLKADGTAQTWAISTVATTTGVTTDATVPMTGYSEWFYIYVEPDINNPAYGTIYLRAKASSGGRSHGFTSDQDGLDWNTNFPNHKSLGEYKNNATITTSFIGATVNSRYRLAYPDIETVDAGYTVVYFGDSRLDAFFSATAYHRMHWKSKISELNPHITYQNFAIQATTTAQFLGRCLTYLNSSAYRIPDALVIEVASRNDTNRFTESVITADMALVGQIKALCEAKGIKLILVANIAEGIIGTVGWWTISNNYAKSAKYCLDFTGYTFNNYSDPTNPILISSLTTDNIHFNDVGHTLAANTIYPKLLSILEA